MNWQEYQEAVGRLYEQMSEFGLVKKNITIPDKVTGQARQVDVWWEMKLGVHTFKIMIDAKKRRGKIDIKDVEEIIMLAKAVNADKAIIVTNSEWTEPAEKMALFDGLDLKLFTIDEATDLIVEDKWTMCRVCGQDCVVFQNDGYLTINGVISWWLGGKCRECNAIHIHCQGCGEKGITTHQYDFICNCNLQYKSVNESLEIKPISALENDNVRDPNQLGIDYEL